jgi:hypothetical protein
MKVTETGIFRALIICDTRFFLLPLTKFENKVSISIMEIVQLKF